MSTFDDRLRASMIHTAMTRVATEPRPTPFRAFTAAVRHGAPGDALVALATAWRLATLRDRPIALGVRIRAATLAIGVGGLLATSGAVALASVAGVAGHVATQLGAPPQTDSQRPAPSSAPSPSPSPRPVVAPPPRSVSSPAPSHAASSPSPSPSPSPKPSRTPRPTRRPGGSNGGHDGSGGKPRPTSSPGGRDHGGDSGGGQGGTGHHGTPSPEPSETPGGPTHDGSGG